MPTFKIEITDQEGNSDTVEKTVSSVIVSTIIGKDVIRALLELFDHSFELKGAPWAQIEIKLHNNIP